jgi:putative N6-adenine-specific DNA methylase
MNDLQLVAKTLFGLEEVLAKELRQLGAKNVKIGNRSVFFEGDLGFMYKANYNLHTALRILQNIKQFKHIETAGQLYNAISKIDWCKYLDLSGSFRIDVTGKTRFFKNTQFIALKSKDAIVDQFRKKYNNRPNISISNPDLRINLHFQDTVLHVSLDSSGESLHKRGYRSATNLAPVNEVLAAGMVALSNWNEYTNLLDPMCGSGTILIEAAMQKMQIPAGINRDEFGFEKWKNFDRDLFEIIKTSSLKRIKELPKDVKLIGYDKAPSAVEKAIQNVNNANLEEFIKIKQADFFRTIKPKTKTTLLFNPPYDERLRIDTKVFYSKIGDTFKHNYPDTIAWMLIGNIEAVKSVGLRASRKIKLFNGKIETQFVKYEMYSGSKKHKKT